MSRRTQAFAIAASAVLFLLLAGSVLPDLGDPIAEAPQSPWPGEVLWLDRTLDLTVQSFILLAGALAIVLLFRTEPGGVVRD